MMPSTKEPRKRRRCRESEDEPQTLGNAIKKIKLVDLKEYKCCVCSELPIDTVFQCSNGCIICSLCYPQLNPCQCPLCRVPMDRQRPIRCRMAEKTLSVRMVRCRHDQCGKLMMFSELKEHEANECVFKPMDCKFSALGCGWKGIRRDLSGHELECAKNIVADDALEIVRKLTDQLIAFKKFCKKTNFVHSASVCGHRVHRARPSGFEVILTGWMMFDGFGDNHEVYLRAQKGRRVGRAPVIYEVAVKLNLIDETEQSPETEDIRFGVMIEPLTPTHSSFELMMEFNCRIGGERLDSDWMPFDRKLSENEYREMFGDGIGFKIFDFCD